jgi:hypothetical protein
MHKKSNQPIDIKNEMVESLMSSDAHFKLERSLTSKMIKYKSITDQLNRLQTKHKNLKREFIAYASPFAFIYCKKRTKTCSSRYKTSQSKCNDNSKHDCLSKSFYNSDKKSNHNCKQVKPNISLKSIRYNTLDKSESQTPLSFYLKENKRINESKPRLEIFSKPIEQYYSPSYKSQLGLIEQSQRYSANRAHKSKIHILRRKWIS